MKLNRHKPHRLPPAYGYELRVKKWNNILAKVWETHFKLKEIK